MYLHYALVTLRICGLCLGRTSESCFNTANTVYTWVPFTAFLPYISCPNKQKWATRQMLMSMLATESNIWFALPPWCKERESLLQIPCGKTTGSSFPQRTDGWILVKPLKSDLRKTKGVLGLNKEMRRQV